MWPELIGSRLVLSPTRRDDAVDLARCADEAVFAYFLALPQSTNEEAFALYLASLRTAVSEPYTMRLRDTNEVVGCSSFMDVKAKDRAVEIGSTWIAPAFRGTFVNPQVKLLMLRHAFETMGCVRVQLKCDARNERSARSITKLGATFEGRLRNFGVRPDGYVRDALMFSVTDAEWPGIRVGLERRLVG